MSSTSSNYIQYGISYHVSRSASALECRFKKMVGTGFPKGGDRCNVSCIFLAQLDQVGGDCIPTLFGDEGRN